MSLADQFSTLYQMVISGFALALVFDMLRVAANEFRLPSWMAGLMDVLYWIAALIFVFQTLYRSNDGEVRLFVFLGLLLGGCLYFIILGRIVRKAGVRAARLIIGVLGWWTKFLRSLLVVPLIFLVGWFYQFILFLGRLSIFLLKFVLQLFHPVWIWMWKSFKRWFRFNRK